MGHQSQIHHLLYRRGSQHGKARLAGGHDVAVIAKDGQRMGGQGAGAYVEHAGQQLAGDFVHVGNHQQQALGCGVGGGQRTCGQRTVHGPRSTGFTLHFLYTNGLPKQVEPAFCSPFVYIFRHRGGRRDGIDCCHVAECIRDMADGTVAVNSYFSGHEDPSLQV